LLKQAGLTKGTDGVYAKGGKKLSLLAQTTNRTDRINTLQIIQQQYKQVGIGLSMQPLNASDFFNTVLPHRTFEIGLFAWDRAAFSNQVELHCTCPGTFLAKLTAIRDRTTVVSVTLKQTPS